IAPLPGGSSNRWARAIPVPQVLEQDVTGVVPFGNGEVYFSSACTVPGNAINDRSGLARLARVCNGESKRKALSPSGGIMIVRFQSGHWAAPRRGHAARAHWYRATAHQ